MIFCTAFDEHALAAISQHLCPSRLKLELARLPAPTDVYITHIKPGELDAVMAEIIRLVRDTSTGLKDTNRSLKDATGAMKLTGEQIRQAAGTLTAPAGAGPTMTMLVARPATTPGPAGISALRPAERVAGSMAVPTATIRPVRLGSSRTLMPGRTCPISRSGNWPTTS